MNQDNDTLDQNESASQELVEEVLETPNTFRKRLIWIGVILYWILAWRMSSNPDSEILTDGWLILVAPIAYPICSFFQLLSGHTDHTPDLTNWTVRFIWVLTIPLQIATYWVLAKAFQILGGWIQSLRSRIAPASSEDDQSSE
jgi:phage shock protein PspC (stress-responsive transcriptional regulator)